MSAHTQHPGLCDARAAQAFHQPRPRWFSVRRPGLIRWALASFAAGYLLRYFIGAS